MRLTNVLTVELEAHGEFKCSLDTFNSFNARGYTKWDLCKAIAEAYGGGCGKHSTATYWNQFDRSILVIVIGGLTNPLN
jgi:hypothetical protein